MRIDSHQHFWHYNPAEHIWMDDRMSVLKRDHLPDELLPLLRRIDFDGVIAVQARQNLAETQWLLELADRHDFIKGVVGWVDLCSPALASQLEAFSINPKLAGVRHVVHDEPDDKFMLRPEFRRGIAQLRHFKLTYDLLLFPQHLPVARKLVEEFPETPFVIDHMAKPRISHRFHSAWKKDLSKLAEFPTVWCKLSGMVTQTAWGQWHAGDFRPYLDAVFEIFGPSRLMIGSDWPVCTLSANYAATMGIVLKYAKQFSADVRKGIFGGNCARFYNI